MVDIHRCRIRRRRLLRARVPKVEQARLWLREHGQVLEEEV